jgi:hypothetical protein
MVELEKQASVKEAIAKSGLAFPYNTK